MPERFNRCVSGGGRVRTKVLSGGRYMHVCFPRGKVKGRGGGGVAGEVHTKKRK